ncbi:protein RETICULATA-RELATED 3, chloroplastic [Amborella trichopoda]|uniref:Uncharacterized protein n=1 Tax=Amborella trichopoda TaxID=13333 RepID=W1NWF3_AMBTC|nr:protein RETICULATA-RELATED 3, chloroplastic [Amborella trichopoda]ERM99014.1 hypothetical protein AMTR_s00101p00044120 [Amborella trichopoda]|eukprot:XP_006836161.1 protein RETICULATA-RELATED 3, chloroplastic [Amborella trichopoda]
MAQLRCSTSTPHHFPSTPIPRLPLSLSKPYSFSLSRPTGHISLSLSRSSQEPTLAGGDSGDPPRFSGNGGGGGGQNPGDHDHHFSENPDPKPKGLLSLFLHGWKCRVEADPQFPFKVLMEELVGVSACVLGDMASRPNFGLNELDLVFSTLVVGSILNFTLMYLLAPSSLSSSQALPGLFSSCPPSHMFEPGGFGLLSRMGTFVYKGFVFSAVGFVAGLVGTTLSNGLISARKKMDPNFETPNKPPPTLLNAYTWALHMGFSSNFRYQTLNGVEFLLAKGLPPAGFKASVVLLRCLNNVLGGVTFVMLARLTGSQKAQDQEKDTLKEKLIEEEEEIRESQSACK